uniref:Retrotransposon gag domain-containing protein n=1 Tax=Triticum urartu TaxID=4572 RepID=A0A8R7QFA8_TRIUA
MSEIQEENPALSEDWFIMCYINGLREGIKYQMRPLSPATLTDAFCLARDVEPCHPPVVHQKKSSVSYNNYYQKQYTPSAAKTSTTSTVVQNTNSNKHTKNINTNIQMIRKVGECWRCGDKWVHGHKCTLVPNVHMLQQEVEENGPTDVETEQENQEGMAEQSEQAMFISSHVMGQHLTTQCPIMIISLNGKRAVALLDSGSSSSFINEQFAL